MTTAIYKEEHFAACDSLWTNDGGLVRRDITEKKGITFNFKDSELVSFMAGNHVAIALMQAMQLSVITNEHYANLMTLYMEHTDMQMSMVVFFKSTGEIDSRFGENLSRYMVKNRVVANTLGSSGGDFASEFLYFSSKRLRKKRRKKGNFASSSGCNIVGAVNYAYTKDSASGGKVFKIQWKDGQTVYSNIPLSNQHASERYKRQLKDTLVAIHSRYDKMKNKNLNLNQNQNYMNTAAKQASSNSNKQVNANASSNDVPLMTMSRVINYAKIFS